MLTIILLIQLLSNTLKYSMYNYLYKQTEVALSLHAQLISQEIDKFISDATLVLKQIVYVEDIYKFYDQPIANNSLLKELNIIKSQNQNIFNVWLYDISTQTILDDLGQNAYEGFEPTSREWFITLINNKESLSITEPYKDVFSNKDVISIAMPIYSNNELAGIAGIDIVIDQLIQLVESQQIGKNRYMSLLTKSGKIISHIDSSNKLQQLEHLNVSKELLNAVDSNINTVVNYSKNSMSLYGAVYTLESSPFIIIYSVTEAEFFKEIIFVLNMLNGLLLFSTLCIILSVYILIKWQTKDIKKLKFYCTELESGNINFDIPSSLRNRKDEIGILIKRIIQAQHHEVHKNMMVRQLKLQLEHYKFYEQYTNTLRKFKHDFKNHVIIINTLSKENKNKELFNYLQSLNESFNKISYTPYCKNFIIDSILANIAYKATPYAIPINTNISISNINPLSDIELVVILGNLLDNALEATIKSNLKTSINIKITQKNTFLLISVDNGYTCPIIKENAYTFQSTKADKQFHGLGLKSVCEIVNKYNGHIKFFTTNNVFKVNIMINYIYDIQN